MRSSYTLFAVVAALSALTVADSSEQALGFYVALQSTGVLEIDFDPSKDVNHSLKISKYNTNAGFQVNWVTASHDKIYSISRSQFPDNATMSGGVFGFSEPRNLQATNLTLIDTQSSKGEGGVFLDVSPDGKTLAAANIDGGTVSIFPLSPSGAIGKPTYTFQYTITTPGPGAGDSQTQANPHESIFDPSGKYIFVPDRGADRVRIYSHCGPTDVSLIETLVVDPGTGPRHIAFASIDDETFYFYLISELENAVRTYIFDHSTAKPIITLKQIISTIGLGTGESARTAPNNNDLAAELAISADGRFLYASNRNTQTLDPDTVAIFSRNTTTGTLTYLKAVSSHGKIPRMFALSPDPANKYVAIANEATQDITVLERDASSGMIGNVVGRILLGETDTSLTEGPICVLWK